MKTILCAALLICYLALVMSLPTFENRKEELQSASAVDILEPQESRWGGGGGRGWGGYGGYGGYGGGWGHGGGWGNGGGLGGRGFGFVGGWGGYRGGWGR